MAIEISVENNHNNVTKAQRPNTNKLEYSLN